MTKSQKFINAVMMVAILLPALAGAAEKSEKIAVNSAAPEARPEIWRNLAQTCDKDWTSYEKQLLSLRADFTREIGVMTQKQYDEIYQKDDARLIFVGLTWPSDLSDKDEFWKGNKDCSDLHWEIRKSLKSGSEDRKVKEKRVSQFKDCVLTRYDRLKVIAPFDLLIPCYEKRAATP